MTLTLTRTPAEVFRDYETDGVPASGVHEVEKSDARTLLDEMYQHLNRVVLQGALFGLTTSNNASDATNDIDIATGACRSADDTDTLVLASALTKRMDAAWSVGSNQGGMDTGTKPASGAVYIWAIKRSDTGVVDALFSISATAPTMPANYDKKRCIAAIMMDGSSAIRPYTQTDDEFLFTTPVADVAVTTQSTTAISRTVSVPASAKALLSVYATNASAWQLRVKRVAATDATVSTTNCDMAGPAAGPMACHLDVWTDSNSQISTRANAASTTVNIATRGYIFRRGRLS